MKLIGGAIFTALIVTATAASQTQKIKLGVETDNEDFKTATITALHEGAGINWCFLAATSQGQGQEFTYDGKHMYLPLPNLETAQALTLVHVPDSDQSNLQFSVIDYPLDVSFNEKNYLILNGTLAELFACKNLPYEPYEYSKSGYAVVKSPVSEDCFHITLKKVK